MLNFLDNFLSWLKCVIVQDDPKFVYEVFRSPESKEIVCIPLGKRSESQVLTQDYIDKLFK